MVAKLPLLSGTVLEALTAVLGGAQVDPACAAAIVLGRLAQAGADKAGRVISTPGFTKVGSRLAGIFSARQPAQPLNPATT
jgi:hypothetical protein